MSLLNKVFKKKEDGLKEKTILAASEEKRDAVAKNPEKKADVLEAEKNKIKAEDKRIIGAGCKILMVPLITEKTETSARNNKYIFKVFRNANKIEIRNTMKNIYGVNVKDVNIINMKGKKIGRMSKISGKRNDWKKAIVTLLEGESINIYETGK